MRRKCYIIRRHNALECLNSIGWKVKVSNEEVVENLFNKTGSIDAYLAVFVNGEPSSFTPYFNTVSVTENVFECPATLDNVLGEIK